LIYIDNINANDEFQPLAAEVVVRQAPDAWVLLQ